MIRILRGNDVRIEWRFSFDSFEYQSGQFKVYSGNTEIVSDYEIRDNVLYATIPGYKLSTGIYSMVFTYINTNGKLQVRKSSDAFTITESEKEVVDGVVVSDTASYGRTLYSLLDVLSNKKNDNVEGSIEGNVLSFRNGLWKGVNLDTLKIENIELLNKLIIELQGYFTNGVANSALRLSDSAEYKAWGQVFFKDGKPVNVSGEGTFTHITAESLTIGNAVFTVDGNTVYVSHKGDSENSVTPINFLVTGALATRALGDVEEEGTGGGMDHVYNVDDFSKALDSFNKVSETDTFNAYAIRSLYEMVKNIENSSTDTSYVDEKIEEVNKKIDTNTAYLSEWIERVEDTLQENIDTVAGDLSTLQTTVNDFLTGTDTDTIINRWKELESFLNGYTETATLADLLSVKADKATTLAGYGITNAYTKTEVDNKITSVNTDLTNLQTTVSGHTTSIANLQSTVSGHTSSITSINGKITTLQGYFTNGVANSALRLSDSAEYKAWGQVFFKDGKPANVSGAATFTQVNADSVVFGDKARLAYDSTLNALLLTRDDGTAVHFLASGAVSTRGLGDLSDSDTGGTGTGVDLLNVPSDIIPSVGATYSLGSSDNFWKMIYANGGIIGSTYIASDRVIFGTYIQGQSWAINPDGSATFSSLTINGASAATQNWVNSQLSSYATTSALSSYATNEALSSESAARRGSTLSGAQLPNGQGYSVTWQTSQAGAQTVTIPTFGSLGYESIDDYYNKNGLESFLVDGVLMDSLLIYIEDAISAGGNVDLSGYVLKEGGTINNPTLTGDVVGNGWAIEGSIAQFGEVNASSLYVNDVAVTPSNYVTLNTEQTISGKKTFTGGITANNGITASHIYSVEYIDSSALTINAETINLTYDGDDADLQVGLINGYKPLTIGNTSFAPSLTSGTVIGTITIGGESKTIYAPSGSNVDLSNYVTLNGEQTITGAKTFSNLLSDKITLQGFELTPYNPNGGTPDRLMYDGYVLLDEYNFGEYLDSSYVKKAGDTMTGQLGFTGSTHPHIYGNGSELNLGYANGGYKLSIKSDYSFSAGTTDFFSLGKSTNRWKNIYSVLGNFSGQITSTVADGTAPFVVASKTLVSNLNADMLDGKHLSDILASDITGNAATATYATSAGNADTLDGLHADSFDRVYTSSFTVTESGWYRLVNVPTNSSDLDWKDKYLVVNTVNSAGSACSASFKILYSTQQGWNIGANNEFIVIPLTRTNSKSVGNVRLLSNNGNFARYIDVYIALPDGTTAISVTMRGNIPSDNLASAATLSFDDVSSFYKVIEYNADSQSGRAIGGLIAEKATKLSTARTLWGNSFDGSGNVSGNLTGVGTIIGSGLLGLVSTNNDIYLRRNGTDTTSLALNASAFKPFDVANGLLNLGSTSARWNGIYGKTLDLSGNATISGTLGVGNRITVPTSSEKQSSMGIATSWTDCWKYKIADVDGTTTKEITIPHYGYAIGWNQYTHTDGTTKSSVGSFISDYFGLNLHSYGNIDFSSGSGDTYQVNARINNSGLSVTKAVNVGTTLYTHGKTSTSDGKAGFYAIGGNIGITGAIPAINFYYGNSTTSTSQIKETASGTLQFGGYSASKLLYNAVDATMKVYSLVNSANTGFGNEMVAMQTCFDGVDPETHAYVTEYKSRCNLLLQPRGGQVYVGYTPTSLQSNYALNVGDKIRLYGANNGASPEILFYRDGVSSWKIINNGGYLFLQNNYTTSLQSSYFNVLSLSSNTGDATLKGSLKTGGNIVPSTHGTYTLGTSSSRWLDGYINNLYAETMQVNEVTGSGWSIEGSIATFSEVNADALYVGDSEVVPSNYVTLDGEQNITGQKVFSSINVGSLRSIESPGTSYIGFDSTANVFGGLTVQTGSLSSPSIVTDELTSKTSPYLSVTAASLDLMSCELYGYDDNSLDVWSIDFGGNAYFASVTQTSDVNYKNILSDVHLKLSDIAGAPTFRFTWVNENDGKIHLGTSAQYWQEIASELVTANKKTGKLGLDYSTAALVSAVSIAREVNTMKMWQTSTTDKLTELEDRVKALEAENKELRELLDNKE